MRRRYGKGSIDLLGEIGFLGRSVGIPHDFFIAGRNGVESGGCDELALLRDCGLPLSTARFRRVATPVHWTPWSLTLQRA
jgi:hypothetical protein